MFGIIKEVGLTKYLKAGVLEIYRKIVREQLYNSYSQDWEDLDIDKILNYQKKGFYIEIGGYDPKRLSNTYRFYKKGWKGLIVEPNPDIKEKFIKIRPRDKFLSVGVGKDNGMINYYQYLIPALNTFSKKSTLESQSKGYKINKITKIKIIGIKKLLNQYVELKKFEILSIDTEGFDYQILKHWDWKYRPKVICVEKDKNNKIKNLLTKKGYKLDKETRYNLIFVYKKIRRFGN